LFHETTAAHLKTLISCAISSIDGQTIQLRATTQLKALLEKIFVPQR